MTKEEHVRHLLEDPVYAIMGNEELCLGRSNMDVAKELIAAGVTIIQYREKHKKWRAKYEEAKAIAQLCHDHDVTFIMNDSTDLASPAAPTASTSARMMHRPRSSVSSPARTSSSVYRPIPSMK